MIIIIIIIIIPLCQEDGIFRTRRNISIGIPLNLSIPTEMGYIQLLVESENSAKLLNCVILTYVRSFIAHMTQIINILVVKVSRIIKHFIFLWKISKMSINRSEETTVALVFLH